MLGWERLVSTAKSEDGRGTESMVTLSLSSKGWGESGCAVGEQVMNLPLAMMGLGIAAWGVPCGQQLETRLRRAVQGHEVSCLGRDAVEDAGLCTPKALSPAPQGDVHQTESLVNRVGKY